MYNALVLEKERTLLDLVNKILYWVYSSTVELSPFKRETQGQHLVDPPNYYYDGTLAQLVRASES